MANLELKNKINVPFADKGDKINVPDTSSEGTVNMTDGFGSKYDTPIAEGGEYIYREEMNEILNKVYTAVKELQDLAITAGFPVDMTKALNVLPLANGGTGANNADNARKKLQTMQFYIAQTGINNDLNNITNTCVGGTLYVIITEIIINIKYILLGMVTNICVFVKVHIQVQQITDLG